MIPAFNVANLQAEKRLISFRKLLVRHERTLYISVRNCTRDEGRPLEIGLQEQASNHLKLRW